MGRLWGWGAWREAVVEACDGGGRGSAARLRQHRARGDRARADGLPPGVVDARDGHAAEPAVAGRTLLALRAAELCGAEAEARRAVALAVDAEELALLLDDALRRQADVPGGARAAVLTRKPLAALARAPAGSGVLLAPAERRAVDHAAPRGRPLLAATVRVR